MKHKPKIIAIASVSGGGKTAVTKRLAQKLPKSVSLHFDDYEFNGAIENYETWLENGADYNIVDLQPLKRDLDTLLKSEKYKFIILDYPFAYKNNLISTYIDFAVYIDTPLDVAMARRILRDTPSIKELTDEMMGYLSYARRAYQLMPDIIRPNSDLVVDGTQTVEEISEAIKNEMINFKLINPLSKRQF